MRDSIKVKAADIADMTLTVLSFLSGISNSNSDPIIGDKSIRKSI